MVDGGPVVRRLLAGVVVLVLVGCAAPRAERRTIDGVDCVVISGGAGSEPGGVDCDWSTADPTRRESS